MASDDEIGIAHPTWLHENLLYHYKIEQRITAAYIFVEYLRYDKWTTKLMKKGIKDKYPYENLTGSCLYTFWSIDHNTIDLLISYNIS